MVDPLNLNNTISEFRSPGDGEEPPRCDVTIELTCNYDIEDPPALNVHWVITDKNIEFGSTQDSGKVVIRINDTTDPWFTTGSDIWWATNYEAFTNSGKLYRDADWNYNIRADTPYDVWATAYSHVDPEAPVCVTAETPITCDPPLDPPEDPPVEPPVDPPADLFDEEPPLVIPPPVYEDVVVQVSQNNQQKDLPTTAISNTTKMIIVGITTLILGIFVYLWPEIKARYQKKDLSMRETL